MIKKIVCLILAAALCAVGLISCSPAGGNDKNTESLSTGDDSVSTDGYKRPPATFPPEEPKWEDTLDEPGEVTILEREARDYIVGSWAGCTWGSMFYFSDWSDGGIWYQDVNNVQPTKLPLHNDALSDGSDNPFAQLKDACILVDEDATIKNGGAPVLIICGTFPIGYSEETGIVDEGTMIGSFDTLTNKWTVISDDVEGEPMEMSMYRDTIFFVTATGGEDGYVLHKINRDGSGYSSMENEEPTKLSIGWIHNDVIYYVEYKTLSVCSCNLDFSDRHVLFDGTEGVGKIKNVTDDYIYYTSRIASDYTEDLYRRSLTDITKPELIVKNATGGFHGDVFYYYTTYGGDGHNVMFSYNTVTGETKTIYDITDISDKIQKSRYACGDTYIICEFTYMGGDTSGMHYTCMDLVSGKEWLIPD